MFRPRAPPLLPQIYDGEHEDPDRVDEVPVPGRRLEWKVLLRGDLPPEHGAVDDVQEDEPEEDVKPMESRQHEERASKDPALDVERGAVQESVLVGLAAEENGAQGDRHEDGGDDPVPASLLHGGVPQMKGDAAEKKDEGVHCGNQD